MCTDENKSKEELIRELNELRSLPTRQHAMGKINSITNELQFSDLIDIDEIQSIQDSFASATGVASIITHPDGRPITKPSNFCRLCSEIIRCTDIGLKNCYASDAVIGRLNADGPIIQPCLSGGLWDAGASIQVGNQHIANWLIGQVRTDQLNDDVFLEYARIIDADKEQFKEALSEVTIMPLEQFKSISRTLFLFARQISQLAFKNLLLTEADREWKATIESLKKSEERYRGLFDNMSSGVAIYEAVDNGTDYVFRDFNKAAQEIENTPKEELLGKRVTKVFPGVVEFGLLSVFRDVWKSGIPQSHPISFYKDDKLQGWRENYVIRLSSGEVLAIYNDQTEQQKALSKLHASEERFRLLVEQSPLSIEIYNKDGFMIQANRAWEYLWNIPNRDDFIMSYNIYKDKQLMEMGVSEKVRQAFTGKSFDLPELVYKSRTTNRPGRSRCVHTSIYPLKSASGDVLNVVIMYEDITERVEGVNERNRLFKELETKNAALERFTYTVSHDLKSPLITIRGFLGMVKKDFKTANYERIQEDIVRIDRAANRMYSLLDDVLHLSRIGRTVNINDLISLTALAGEIVDMFKERLQEKSIEVIVSDDLPTVRGDRTRLYEVFQNLIENAIKFIGDTANPRIEVGTTIVDAKTVTFVKDNGVGVESQFHETIFDLFDQLNQETEGSGVGLALVKRIIETHGGHIWIESEGTGLGTTFNFYIPEKQN